jgi:CheY-like chemotaxis protein
MNRGWTDHEQERLRVLIVDRSLQLSRLLVDNLQERHDIVGVVACAGSAIERLGALDDPRQRPLPADVVLVGDQLIGEIGGRQLIAYLNLLWPSLRCIFHTSDHTLTSIRGAIDIVHRPVKPSELHDILDRLAPSNVGTA